MEGIKSQHNIPLLHPLECCIGRVQHKGVVHHHRNFQNMRGAVVLPLSSFFSGYHFCSLLLHRCYRQRRVGEDRCHFHFPLTDVVHSSRRVELTNSKISSQPPPPPPKLPSFPPSGCLFFS